MKTILDRIQKETQLRRLEKLRPGSRPRWGMLTAGNLLPHLTDPFRIALGELEVKPIKSFLSTSVGKFIAIYLMPRWPKGAPTHAKTDINKEGRKGKIFEEDRRELVAVIDRFIAAYPNKQYEHHPVFGRISNKTWAVVMTKHLDHHFRQFEL